MIDMPPQLPIQPEQAIAQKLVDCGLDAKGFTVEYVDYLQSIEIVVRQNAKAYASQFVCIDRAAGYEIVTFEDSALQAAYTHFTTELYRPRMIADATATLKRLGLLDNFPKRSSFGSLEEYAHALETHCGLTAGSVLKVHGDTIWFKPPRETGFDEFSERYSKLLAAIFYASATSDFEGFAFLGNEAIAGTQDDAEGRGAVP